MFCFIFINSFYIKNKNVNETKVLTHALELLLELDLMFTISDPEVKIRVLALQHAVSWRGGTDGQDGGRTLSSLSLAYFFNSDHFRYLNKMNSKL